jgi:hypothetical protein
LAHAHAPALSLTLAKALALAHAHADTLASAIAHALTEAHTAQGALPGEIGALWALEFGLHRLQLLSQLPDLGFVRFLGSFSGCQGRHRSMDIRPQRGDFLGVGLDRVSKPRLHLLELLSQLPDLGFIWFLRSFGLYQCGHCPMDLRL